MKKVYALIVLLSVIFSVSLQAQVGSSCVTPHVITALPFDSVGMSTANAADNYDASPCTGATDFMSGNDYVFSYTPATNELVNITISGISALSGAGLFITDACPDDVSATCIAEETGTMVDLNSGGVNLVAGTEYFIIVSSRFYLFTGQTTSFDIIMQSCSGTPVADFTYVADNTTLTFTNTSQNAVSYSWLFGDEGFLPTPDTSMSPVHTYAETGQYVVSLTVTNDCGITSTITDTIDVTCSVSTAPDAGFTYIINDATVTFTNASTNATSYEWYFGDEAIVLFPSSTEASPIHAYNQGTYTVQMIALNCFTSDTFTVTYTICLSNLPVADFTYVENGMTVDFTSTATDATSYGWFFGDEAFPLQPTSTDANPSHTYTSYGDFVVTFTATNACGSHTITDTLHLVCPGSLPSAAFTYVANAGVVSFTNTSSDAVSYQWLFGDEIVLGVWMLANIEQSPEHTYTTDGTYTVYMVATNECGTDTTSQIITIIGTGIETVNINSALNCYPNPVKNVLTIETEGAAFVCIYNILGQVVYQYEISGNIRKDINV